MGNLESFILGVVVGWLLAAVRVATQKRSRGR